MTSGQGKIGAALVLGILLMALVGVLWPGKQDTPQMAVVDAPMQAPIQDAPRTQSSFQAPPPPIVKPMGPFAPPIPETPPPVSAEIPAPETPPSTVMQPQAWARHAQPSHPDPRRLPMIAIVIDDMGIAPARVAAALALPAAVTMAVLPYANDAAAVARQARLLGHEVLVHLPMEADNGQNPGPHALLTQLTPEAFAENLKWNLTRLEGYVGVNNHMGSKLTQDSAAMHLLMVALKQRGLLFLDSRTAAQTLAATTARSIGVTTLQRDIFLDNVVTKEMIHAQLQKTEEIAKHNGYAIAIGHPHQATVEALGAWAADLETRGYRLAPLSAIARLHTSGKRVVALPPPGG